MNHLVLRKSFQFQYCFYSSFTATLIIPLTVYQTHTMDATTSWLSQARLDCYLYGHGFIAPNSWKLAGKVIEGEYSQH